MADEFAQKAVRKVRIFCDRIWKRVILTEEKCMQVHIADAALSTAFGGITFPLCLGVMQTGIFRPLRITSNLRFIGSLCGSISLLVSGSTASLVFLSSVLLLQEAKDSSMKTLTKKLHSFVPNKSITCARDIPVCGVASAVVFKLLGGRFRSVLPSSLIHPGAFARGYIPAKGKKYASDGVKQRLTLLGKKHGCHSCGKKWRTSFVGDHIPPNMLVREGQRQRFYPQCKSCSYQQGAALSSTSRLLLIKTHGSSLRLYHLWLPLPVPLALLRNYIKDESGLQDSSVETDINDEEPHKFLKTIVKDVLIFLKLRDKDDEGND